MAAFPDPDAIMDKIDQMSSPTKMFQNRNDYGFRCQSPGSKVQRSKVQRLDNSRKRRNIRTLKYLNLEPLNPEPYT